jgi:hypothetical protein
MSYCEIISKAKRDEIRKNIIIATMKIASTITNSMK